MITRFDSKLSVVALIGLSLAFCGCQSTTESDFSQIQQSCSERQCSDVVFSNLSDLEKENLIKESLDLWNESAPAKNTLVAYLKEITNSASKDFIPLKDRIAVFDFDGTLFCETDPNYFDYMLLLHRVLEDQNYKSKASKFEREVAKKIKEQNETGKAFENLETDHGKAVASAFSGLSVDEFYDYIKEFSKQPMPSYSGMNRGDGFYKPMLQIVELLRRHGFTVYIVSGTDRLILRGLLRDSVIDIPLHMILGSDESLKASGQKEVDGLKYVFTDNDKVVLGGDFLVKNLKMNKVSLIMQEIGQQPVLAFGNSSGDSSMTKFVTTRNKYRSLAFLLEADDLVRENGSMAKAEKIHKLCEENNWIPISMKNDWLTIYGDKVIKN